MDQPSLTASSPAKDSASIGVAKGRHYRKLLEQVKDMQPLLTAVRDGVDCLSADDSAPQYHDVALGRIRQDPVPPLGLEERTSDS